nr:MAG TPA: hypothetical protein [Caudoviricetes sp.]
MFLLPAFFSGFKKNSSNPKKWVIRPLIPYEQIGSNMFGLPYKIGGRLLTDFWPVFVSESHL